MQICAYHATMRAGYLVLEDGTVFAARSVGAPGVAAGEACFTTAMAGYQEAVTDPSYAAQVLCFSYPLVGNYGVAPGRMESGRVWCEGVVMRRSRPAWSEWLRHEGVVALEEVDTRALVRRIRDGGVLRCALGEAEPDELLARALAEPPIDGRPLGRDVGAAEAYSLGTGPRVTLLDLGTKRSIPRRLAAAGLEVLVVPGGWDAEQILETEPGAVLVSNGPGDPAVLTGQIETIRGLLGRVLVTVQNHGYAVEATDSELVTHVSLNDGTVEGLAGEELATVQFHPEAAPGPLDALPFFDQIAAACRSERIFALS